ncbi:TPA: hypothetical protein DF272_02435 [Candidatus Falkowbacteria bacterium]|nr:hypothetical protein [Candidatus Falkowbacteria bacterium]
MTCPECGREEIRVMVNITQCHNKRYFICVHCRTVFTGSSTKNPLAENYLVAICPVGTKLIAESNGIMGLVIKLSYPTVQDFARQHFRTEKNDQVN